MTEDELWDALGAMLAELDDGHVMMAAPGRPRFHSNRVRRENLQDDAFDVGVVRDRYLSDVHEDPHYLYGTLDDDLAYVWFPYIADNMATIDTVIDEFPDAKGLVIDLRHNSGGDFTWAFEYLGRLTTEDRFVFRSRTRNGPDRGDFDDWTEWTLNARSDPFTRPIVLLTDGHTISAGERTVMALQVLPTVTTVGMPTNGSQSTMIGREAPNRWTFTLPVQEVEFADGNVYEGSGMPVDVEVLNSPDDLEEGVDTMLEQAIQQLTGR
jgi:C-terminal processing protease CtpA/Prc